MMTLGEEIKEIADQIKEKAGEKPIAFKLSEKGFQKLIDDDALGIAVKSAPGRKYKFFYHGMEAIVIYEPVRRYKKAS